MSENLKNLGSYLKQIREEKGLTLKDVESVTFVRESYLKAIEEGVLHQQITAVYVQGFVKQYARFLGLDIEQMLAHNPGLVDLPKHVHEFAYGIGTLEYRNSFGSTPKWIPLVSGIGMIILLGIGIWFFFK